MLWITKDSLWGEITVSVDDLKPVCEDEKLREAEEVLRQTIFVAKKLSCDEVVKGIFPVPRCIRA